jgi:hypothetical protein
MAIVVMKKQFWKLDHNQAKCHPPDGCTCAGHHRPPNICRFYRPFGGKLSPSALVRVDAADLRPDYFQRPPTAP